MAQEQELGMIEHRSKRKSTKKQNLSFEFNSDVNDDLLLQILVRLPHARSAIQCSLVYKHWASLIFSDYFTARFNHRHHRSRYLDPTYYVPYTLLFRVHHGININAIVLASYELSSGHPAPASYLDFLPHHWRRGIVASSEDVWLVFNSTDQSEYCVCNPLLRQWNLLPPDNSMNLDYEGCLAGIWCDPTQNSPGKPLGSYKVVLFGLAQDNHIHVADVFAAAIFCSDAGGWTRREFTVPAEIQALMSVEPLTLHDAVTSNGVIYFPVKINSEKDLAGILAVGRQAGGGTGECRFIGLPGGFCSGQATNSGDCMGVVRDRLRISQLVRLNEDINLKVWELCDDNGDQVTSWWILVHNVSVKKDKRVNVFMASLHPNNGDLIFVMVDDWICMYNDREDRYEKVGRIPNFRRLSKKYLLNHVFTVHSIVHTSWNGLKTVN